MGKTEGDGGRERERDRERKGVTGKEWGEREVEVESEKIWDNIKIGKKKGNNIIRG